MLENSENRDAVFSLLWNTLSHAGAAADGGDGRDAPRAGRRGRAQPGGGVRGVAKE